jgi:proline iminopeptidase
VPSSSTELTLATARVSASGCNGSTDLSQLPHRDFAVTSGDVTLHVWTVGGNDTSPVLLVLNGGPGVSHDYMDAFGCYASADFRVVFFDQRGMGKSTTPTQSGFGAADFARDIEAVRVALGVDKMHLLGHSYGGGFAQAYVLAQPSHVASLELIDTNPPTDLEWMAGEYLWNDRIRVLQQAGKIPDSLPDAQGDDCLPSLAALWPSFNADPAFKPPPEFEQTTCSARASNAVNGEFPPYDFRQALGKTNVPVMVIFGAKDPFGLKNWQAPTVAAFPAANTHEAVVPNAGHFPWLEQPKAFDDALRSFFSQVLSLSVGPGLD